MKEQHKKELISNSYKINLNDDNLDDLLILYKYLNVPISYLKSFYNITKSLDKIYKSSFLSKEFVKMSKIKLNIEKLKKNIENREKIIEILIKYNNYLNKNNTIINSKTLTEELKLIFKDLRIVSINIILLIKKLQKQISYDSSYGKFTLKEIINYDNYLMKMKNDVLFLNKSCLNKFFNFNEIFDTFFTNLKREINYDEKIGNLIIKCQYFLIKESIQMDMKNNLNKEKNKKNNVKNDDKNNLNRFAKKDDDDDDSEESSDEEEEESEEESEESKKNEEKPQEGKKSNDKKNDIKNNNNKNNEKNENKNNNKNNEKNNNNNNKNNLNKKNENNNNENKKNNNNKNENNNKNNNNKNNENKENNNNNNENKNIEKLESKPVILNSIENTIEFTYENLTGNESTISKKYSEYYQKIPQELIQNFNIQPSLNYYLTGIFPQIFLISKEKKSFGLAIISFISETQLKILNFSTIEMKNFSLIFSDLIKYLKKNFNFEEIFIDFYYTKIENKFIINKNIENILIKELKFKWILMENDGLNRKIKYKISNEFFNEKKSLNLIKAKNYFLFNLKNINNENNLIESNLDKTFEKFNSMKNGEKEINIFPLYSLFCEMMYNNEYEVNLPEREFMNQEVMKEISENIIKNFINVSYKKFKNFVEENYKNNFDLIQLNNIFDDENNENSNENNEISNEKNSNEKNSNEKNSNEKNENSNEKNSNENKKFLCGGILDLNINFNNVISTKIDNKKYNVIFDENIQILTVNETNEIFYLIPTKNEKISLILYEKKENKKSKLNEFFNTKNNNNEITLFEYFNEIYNKINNNNIQTKKRIFLPIFNEKKYLNFNVPKLLENYTIDASDQNTYNIENYEQGSNFENEFDSKSEKNYIEFNIEKDDLIIKNDFIIAVINYDVLNEFEIPSLITFLVNI